MLSWTVRFGLCCDTWDNLQLDTTDSAGKADRNQAVPSTGAEGADWAEQCSGVPWHCAGTDRALLGQRFVMWASSEVEESNPWHTCPAMRGDDQLRLFILRLSEISATGLWGFCCNPSSLSSPSTLRALLVAQVGHRTRKQTLIQHLLLEVQDLFLWLALNVSFNLKTSIIS